LEKLYLASKLKKVFRSPGEGAEPYLMRRLPGRRI